MKPRRADRRTRREEILAAAIRVFARRGYAASRIDDIAQEAGVAKGSVYLYFDSREQLLHVAAEAFTARSAAVLAEAAAGRGGARERLERLVRGVVAMLTAEPDLARVLLDLWAASRWGPQSPLDLAATYREYRAAIAALLEEATAQGCPGAVDAHAHATVLVGAIEGCVLQWLIDPEVDPAALVDPLVRLLLPEPAPTTRPDPSR
ncbi:TetR/AcrR family transcriptional regulator [Nocardiopsis ansamitocini]|uniref:Transcriptional regulator n=1 Tax=Nocardiopsis ansamitocini TaxID=1670832 RepID=A0A9W6UKV2_9ACTN|nr:TetR/AcrR family transcriptional regulator [Nocardiopsis ansamitocini]GLU49998.1 transcriptional regulator [Nocardiopsis ansamitocini]